MLVKLAMCYNYMEYLLLCYFNNLKTKYLGRQKWLSKGIKRIQTKYDQSFFIHAVISFQNFENEPFLPAFDKINITKTFKR